MACRLSFINVGYGEAILLELPKQTILLDGGSNLASEYAGEAQRIKSLDYLKWRGIQKIDLLIITHIHEDHVCGVWHLLSNASIEVKEVVLPFAVTAFAQLRRVIKPHNFAKYSSQIFYNALYDYCQIIDYCICNNINIKHLEMGDSLILATEQAKEIVAERLLTANEPITEFLTIIQQLSEYVIANRTEELAEKVARLDYLSNATSMVLHIQEKSGESKTASPKSLLDILLPGDCTPNNWRFTKAEIASIKDVLLLKLPHHGQIDAIQAEKMAYLPLRYIVTSASNDHRNNSSRQEVYAEIAKWREHKIKTLFTEPVAEQLYTLKEFNTAPLYQAIEIAFNTDTIDLNFVFVN